MTRITRTEALRQEALLLLERANQLDSRPEEPIEDEDGAAVVWFRKRFRTGPSTRYTYAAVKAKGRWYVSGANLSGRRFTWDELLDWIEQNAACWDLWVATAFDQLGELVDEDEDDEDGDW